MRWIIPAIAMLLFVPISALTRDKAGEDMLVYECSQLTLAKDGMRCGVRLLVPGGVGSPAALLIYVSRSASDPKWGETEYLVKSKWRFFQQLNGELLLFRRLHPDGTVWETRAGPPGFWAPPGTTPTLVDPNDRFQGLWKGIQPDIE